MGNKKGEQVPETSEASDVAPVVASPDLEARLVTLEAAQVELGQRFDVFEHRFGHMLEELEKMPETMATRIESGLSSFQAVGDNLGRLVELLKEERERATAAIVALPAQPAPARPNVAPVRPPASAGASSHIATVKPPASAGASSHIATVKPPARPPASAKVPPVPGSHRTRFQPPPGALQHPVPVEAPPSTVAAPVAASAVDPLGQLKGMLEQAGQIVDAVPPAVQGILKARIASFGKELDSLGALVK